MVKINHKRQHDFQPGQIKFCPLCGGTMAEHPVEPEGKLHPVCAACGFVLYFNPKVVACTLVEEDGAVVLLKRSIPPARGKWTIPGGYVDRGEPVREAAVRETREEVNLDVELTSLLNVYSYPGAVDVIVVYLARAAGGALAAGHESAAVGRFTSETIPWGDLAFPSTEQALRDWVARQSPAR